MNFIDELYSDIVATYGNGYYIYAFVINFKPDGPYDSIHPAKAHRKFKAVFEKYFKRIETISYLCFAELSDGGKYHIHGLMFDNEKDYDAHEKRLKNIRNWMRRSFGWHGFQRIYSLTMPYQTTDLRFIKKTLTTTFEKIWSYLIKDLKQFKFLWPFGELISKSGALAPAPVHGLKNAEE